jgi:predicted transcriptional regulator
MLIDRKLNKGAQPMANQMLRKSIKAILQNHQFLTHTDIAKELKKDKSKISGYLEAMVDYGELSVKKVGNSKIYFMNERVKK